MVKHMRIKKNSLSGLGLGELMKEELFFYIMASFISLVIIFCNINSAYGQDEKEEKENKCRIGWAYVCLDDSYCVLTRYMVVEDCGNKEENEVSNIIEERIYGEN